MTTKRVRKEINKPLWHVKITRGPDTISHRLRGVTEEEALLRLDRAYPDGYDLDGQPLMLPPLGERLKFSRR